MKTKIHKYMKKIAIVVGHCKKEPGAYHKSVGSEFEYNSKVAEYLKDIATVFYYDNFDKGYTATIIKDMAPKTKDFDLVLELHFNSFSNKAANGAEALYYFRNELAQKIGQLFCMLMNRQFGSVIRGAKPLRDSTQRGFACVAYQVPTTIILEPFFCTGTEASKFDEPYEIMEYANVLRSLIEQYQDM
jgi:N-acetylmuramoyl-L-alanine amidase